MMRTGGIELNIVPVALAAMLVTIIVLALGIGLTQSFDFAGFGEHEEARSVFTSLVDDVENECRSLGNEGARIEMGQYDLTPIAQISASGTILTATGADFDLTRQVTECSEVLICNATDLDACGETLPGGGVVTIDYYKHHSDGIKLMNGSVTTSDSGDVGPGGPGPGR